MARNIKVRVMLALGYGCGLRAGEIVRLKVGNIDSEQIPPNPAGVRHTASCAGEAAA